MAVIQPLWFVLRVEDKAILLAIFPIICFPKSYFENQIDNLGFVIG